MCSISPSSGYLHNTDRMNMHIWSSVYIYMLLHILHMAFLYGIWVCVLWRIYVNSSNVSPLLAGPGLSVCSLTLLSPLVHWWSDHYAYLLFSVSRLQHYGPCPMCFRTSTSAEVDISWLMNHGRSPSLRQSWLTMTDEGSLLADSLWSSCQCLQNDGWIIRHSSMNAKKYLSTHLSSSEI